MHAIERPHLPRIGALGIGAVVLAIVVLLLAAARVGDIGVSSGTASSQGPASAPAQIHFAQPAASWVMDPLASPFHGVRAWTAFTRR